LQFSQSIAPDPIYRDSEGWRYFDALSFCSSKGMDFVDKAFASNAEETKGDSG